MNLYEYVDAHPFLTLLWGALLVFSLAFLLDGIKAIVREWRIRRELPGLEAAWGLIANAHGGDWSKATPEWRAAAERWRDQVWHRAIARSCGPLKATAHRNDYP